MSIPGLGWDESEGKSDEGTTELANSIESPKWVWESAGEGMEITRNNGC